MTHFQKNLTILIILSTAFEGYTQDKSKTWYRDKKGQTYNAVQFDSVRSVGHPFTLSFIDKLSRGDSTVITFEKISGITANPVIGRYEGQMLPDFKLKDIKGNWITSSGLKGKKVFINFWSVTCGPCIAEMPELNRLKESYKSNKDVVFLAIAPESDERINQFLKKNEFGYTIISGAEYFKLLGIDSYPVNFFTDKAGVIRKVTTGTPHIKSEATGKFEVAVFDHYSKIINHL